VIGGIAALRALGEAGFKPARPIEVVMFTSEEPTRFGLSCSGSRAMAGLLDSACLDTLRDVNGSTYLQAASAAGYGAASTAQMVAGARRTPADLAAFLELHIEQVCSCCFVLVLLLQVTAQRMQKGRRHGTWPRFWSCTSNRWALLDCGIFFFVASLRPVFYRLTAADLAAFLELHIEQTITLPFSPAHLCMQCCRGGATSRCMQTDAAFSGHCQVEQSDLCRGQS
jgi:hypothetical protein